MNVENSVDIQFNPIELTQIYIDRDYDLLSEKLVDTLQYFDRVTYIAKDATTKSCQNPNSLISRNNVSTLS